MSDRVVLAGSVGSREAAVQLSQHWCRACTSEGRISEIVQRAPTRSVGSGD